MTKATLFSLKRLVIMTSFIVIFFMGGGARGPFFAIIFITSKKRCQLLFLPEKTSAFYIKKACPCINSIAETDLFLFLLTTATGVHGGHIQS